MSGAIAEMTIVRSKDMQDLLNQILVFVNKDQKGTLLKYPRSVEIQYNTVVVGEQSQSVISSVMG